MRWFLFVVSLTLWPNLARAEWVRASSAHFVIYADGSQGDVRRFSEQLERYHAALAFVTEKKVPTPSPSNRVTVYVVRSEGAVRDLYGAGSKYVAGFYQPRAGGSMAIVPRITPASGPGSFAMLVLLHEYAHHFIASTSAWSPPRWVSEGGAEFFGSTSFESNGTVLMGRAAQHRAMGVFSREVKVADLLDPGNYEKLPSRSYDAFYGQSWLLYHYLSFDEARSGQLRTYLTLLGQGKGMHEAAVQAFGDFEALEDDMQRYLGRAKLSLLRLPPDLLPIGAIDVQRLSAGEAAMMPIRIQSRRGVDTQKAKALLVEARAIASRFPEDPAVLSALAEAEYDASNDNEAIAAADKAIAIDPAQVNAYVQKGYALFRIASTADDGAAAYQRARSAFVALNRRENDHPIPLFYFFRSYTDQGAAPSPVAVKGLIRAVELAPFDSELRMTLGIALIRLNRQGEAKSVLGPVAYNVHGGGRAEFAGKLLARLEREPGWKGEDMAEIPSYLAGDQNDK